MSGLNVKNKIIFERTQNGKFILSNFSKILYAAGSHYPKFNNWLYFIFIKEMHEGKRSVLTARIGSHIVGLSLLKNTVGEKKICMLYILPYYRQSGIGGQLMDHSISDLGNKNINISVSEKRDLELYPLLKSRGFSIEKKIDGCYRKNIKEYFYCLK